MKIAYLSVWEGISQGYAGGKGYYQANALRKHVGEVICFSLGSDLDAGGLLYKLKYALLLRLAMLRRCLYSLVLSKIYLVERDHGLAKLYAAEFLRQIKRSGINFDLIYSDSSIPVAYMKAAVPIVFSTDAVFGSMVDFFPEMSNLCKRSVAEGNELERRALNVCSLALYSSQWAAKAALDLYGARKEKVRFIQTGANLDGVLGTEENILTRDTSVCRLLFVGFDWARKGGDIAYSTLCELRKSMKCELIVFGCVPPGEIIKDSSVRVMRAFNKQNPEEVSAYANAMACSTFLILPARADCAPAVLKEAAAFGLPVIVSDVGGITSIVKNNVTGLVMPASANGAEYATAIYTLLKDPSAYFKMSRESKLHFDSNLNWTAYAYMIKNCLSQLICKTI